MSFLTKFRSRNVNFRQWVRSGLLVATSAALGGIAVAIWNRRTLADIRRGADENQDFPETGS
jgi:hypothetical protein